MSPVYAFALLCAAISPIANAQSELPLDADTRAVESAHRQFVSLLRRFPLLKDSPVRADGSHGFEFFTSGGRQAVMLDTFRNADDELFNTLMCRADFIVVAKYIASTPRFSRDGKSIYTINQLKVEHSIRSNAAGKIPNVFDLVRFGGEISEHGQTYRVSSPDFPPYAIGTSYLLFLRTGDDGGDQIQAEDMLIEVRENKIFPDRGNKPRLFSADTLDQLRQVLAASETKKACPVRYR